MKPFDLEKALAGEPVRLRDGSKAYVKYVMPDDYKGMYPLRGIRRSVISDTNYSDVIWTKDGNNFHYGSDGDLDIMCMWEEPRPRVQVDLPCPIAKVETDNVYSLVILLNTFNNGEVVHSTTTTKGIYFATKEDAQEWLDAMIKARK